MVRSCGAIYIKHICIFPKTVKSFKWCSAAIISWRGSTSSRLCWPVCYLKTLWKRVADQHQQVQPKITASNFNQVEFWSNFQVNEAHRYCAFLYSSANRVVLNSLRFMVVSLSIVQSELSVTVFHLSIISHRRTMHFTFSGNSPWLVGSSNCILKIWTLENWMYFITYDVLHHRSWRLDVRIKGGAG